MNDDEEERGKRLMEQTTQALGVGPPKETVYWHWPRKPLSGRGMMHAGKSKSTSRPTPRRGGKGRPKRPNYSE